MNRTNYPRPTPEEIADDLEQAIWERMHELLDADPELTEKEARIEAERQIKDEIERARDSFYACAADDREFNRTYVHWRLL